MVLQGPTVVTRPLVLLVASQLALQCLALPTAVVLNLSSSSTPHEINPSTIGADVENITIVGCTTSVAIRSSPADCGPSPSSPPLQYGLVWFADDVGCNITVCNVALTGGLVFGPYSTGSTFIGTTLTLIHIAIMPPAPTGLIIGNVSSTGAVFQVDDVKLLGFVDVFAGSDAIVSLNRLVIDASSTTLNSAGTVAVSFHRSPLTVVNISNSKVLIAGPATATSATGVAVQVQNNVTDTLLADAVMHYSIDIRNVTVTNASPPPLPAPTAAQTRFVGIFVTYDHHATRRTDGVMSVVNNVVDISGPGHSISATAVQVYAISVVLGSDNVTLLVLNNTALATAMRSPVLNGISGSTVIALYVSCCNSCGTTFFTTTAIAIVQNILIATANVFITSRGSNKGLFISATTPYLMTLCNVTSNVIRSARYGYDSPDGVMALINIHTSHLTMSGNNVSYTCEGSAFMGSSSPTSLVSATILPDADPAAYVITGNKMSVQGSDMLNITVPVIYVTIAVPPSSVGQQQHAFLNISDNVQLVASPLESMNSGLLSLQLPTTSGVLTQLIVQRNVAPCRLVAVTGDTPVYVTSIDMRDNVVSNMGGMPSCVITGDIFISSSVAVPCVITISNDSLIANGTSIAAVVLAADLSNVVLAISNVTLNVSALVTTALALESSLTPTACLVCAAYCGATTVTAPLQMEQSSLVVQRVANVSVSSCVAGTNVVASFSQQYASVTTLSVRQCRVIVQQGWQIATTGFMTVQVTASAVGGLDVSSNTFQCADTSAACVFLSVALNRNVFQPTLIERNRAYVSGFNVRKGVIVAVARPSAFPCVDCSFRVVSNNVTLTAMMRLPTITSAGLLDRTAVSLSLPLVFVGEATVLNVSFNSVTELVAMGSDSGSLIELSACRIDGFSAVVANNVVSIETTASEAVIPTTADATGQMLTVSVFPGGANPGYCLVANNKLTAQSGRRIIGLATNVDDELSAVAQSITAVGSITAKNNVINLTISASDGYGVLSSMQDSGSSVLTAPSLVLSANTITVTALQSAAAVLILCAAPTASSSNSLRPSVGLVHVTGTVAQIEVTSGTGSVHGVRVSIAGTVLYIQPPDVRIADCMFAISRTANPTLDAEPLIAGVSHEHQPGSTLVPLNSAITVEDTSFTFSGPLGSLAVALVSVKDAVASSGQAQSSISVTSVDVYFPSDQWSVDSILATFNWITMRHVDFTKANQVTWKLWDSSLSGNGAPLVSFLIQFMTDTTPPTSTPIVVAVHCMTFGGKVLTRDDAPIYGAATNTVNAKFYNEEYRSCGAATRSHSPSETSLTQSTSRRSSSFTVHATSTPSFSPRLTQSSSVSPEGTATVTYFNETSTLSCPSATKSATMRVVNVTVVGTVREVQSTPSGPFSSTDHVVLNIHGATFSTSTTNSARPCSVNLTVLGVTAKGGDASVTTVTSRLWDLVPINPTQGYLDGLGIFDANVTSAITTPLTLTVEARLVSTACFDDSRDLHLDRGSGAVVTIVFTPAPARQPVITTTVSGTTVAVTVIAASVGSVGGAAYAARSNAMLAAINCDTSGLQTPLDVFSSPLQLAVSADDVRYHVGAIVGDAALIVAFGIFVIALGLIRRQYYLHVARGEVERTTGVLSQAAAVAWVRFPSIVVFPVVYFLPVLAGSGLTVLIYGDEVWVRLIGLFGLLVVGLFFGLSGRLMLTKHVFHAQFKENRSTRSFFELRTWRARGVWFVASRGEWEDTHKPARGSHPDTVPSFVRRFDLLFADYVPRCHWFLLVDAGLTCAISVLQALMTASTCNTVQAVLFTSLIIYLGALAFVQPFSSRSAWASALVLGALQLVSGVIAIGQTQVDAESDDGRRLDTAATVVSIVTVVLLVVSALFGVLRVVLRWVLRRAIAVVVRTHQFTRHLLPFDRYDAERSPEDEWQHCAAELLLDAEPRPGLSINKDHDDELKAVDTPPSVLTVPSLDQSSEAVVSNTGAYATDASNHTHSNRSPSLTAAVKVKGRRSGDHLREWVATLRELRRMRRDMRAGPLADLLQRPATSHPSLQSHPL